MEISDYLRRAGRWAWLLLVLPLVAAGVSFALQRDRPVVWSSSATVLTPPGVTDRTGVQYISDYQAALTSDFVVGQVAEETGVPAGELFSGLASAPISPGSSLLSVSFTSEDAAQAEEVPPIAARLALEALLQPIADAQGAQIEISRQQYDEALRAREAYTAETGVQLPAQAYQSALSELASLRNSYELARLEGRDTAAGLAELIATRETELGALANQVVEYNLLENQVGSTFGELTRLRFALASTQAQLDAAASEDTITPGEVTSQEDSTAVVRPVLTAALAGFVVAVLLILGLILVFPRRTNGPPRARRQPLYHEGDALGGDLVPEDTTAEVGEDVRLARTAPPRKP